MSIIVSFILWCLMFSPSFNQVLESVCESVVFCRQQTRSCHSASYDRKVSTPLVQLCQTLACWGRRERRNWTWVWTKTTEPRPVLRDSLGLVRNERARFVCGMNLIPPPSSPAAEELHIFELNQLLNSSVLWIMGWAWLCKQTASS